MREMLLIATAIVCWGCWGVTSKLAVRNMSPMLVQLCITYVYSAVAPIAFLAMKWRGDAIVWTRMGIVWTVMTTALALAANYSFLFAIEARPVHQVMSFTCTYPAVSFLLSWLLLGEAMTLQKAFGAALIVVGCVVMNR